jgi:putative PIG3 family NAD(P)H quinone oxidoreductase
MTKHMPRKMTVIAIAGQGGPETLQPETRQVPEPAAGEVLIEVAFAGVNRPDVLQRLGHYPPPPGASDIPGLEISGTVVALGEGVHSVLPGQRVCALVTGGGYAQYCLARADHCLPVPAALSLAEAAALPETLFTVWHSVFERGWACEGETLLVHGGTSGIGTMAITLARLFGLKVIVTCGSDAKCDAALAHGADYAINYRSQDFGAEVRGITGGTGVELVLDMVAGSYTQRNLDCLAENGRLVTIAVLGGAKAEINMAGLMVKRQTITGSTLRGRSDSFKALLAEEIARTVWPLAAAGQLRPAMDLAFPLAEAGAAQARMEAGDHFGKIVLDLGSMKA